MKANTQKSSFKPHQNMLNVSSIGLKTAGDAKPLKADKQRHRLRHGLARPVNG